MSCMSQWDLNQLATLDERELKAKRATLLEQIDSIEQNTSHSDRDEDYLEELWSKYNQIIDLLATVRPTPRFDPIERLPPEIFRDVITESVNRFFHPLQLPFGSTSVASLILTLVSSRWRDFVLGMPELWTQIHLSVRENDFEARVSLFLELSKTLPIHLTLGIHSKGDLDYVLPSVLLKNKDRIKGISIYESITELVGERRRFVSKVLDQLLPLPNLVHFSFIQTMMRNRSILLDVLKRCKGLHELPGLPLTGDMLSHEAIYHLRRAEIEDTLDVCDRAHQNMPMLEHVVFNPPQESTPQDESLAVCRNSPRTDVYPFRWKSFTCNHSSPMIPRIIHRLVNLSSLEITLTLPQLQGLLMQLHHLVLLEVVGLSLVPSSEVTKSISTIEVHPNPRVRTLIFDSTRLRHPTDAKEALMKAMPALQELTLRMSPLFESLEFYDWSSNSNLKKMNLTFGGAFPWMWELPSTVREVYIENAFHCPHLFSMGARRLTIRPQTGGVSLASIDDEHWPQLRSLSTLGPCWSPNQGPKFTHLREIRLNEMLPIRHPNFRPDLILNSTRLCLHIATRPMDLPSLETLTLSAQPHWDILLLMLERRNLALGTFCPLKVLTILQGYPVELKTVLSTLMNGKYPEWPSLRDISLHGVLELIEDHSITGCQMCIHRLKSCSLNPRRAVRLASALEFPSYPSSEAEVLSTWEQRSALYSERVSDCRWRQGGCGDISVGVGSSVTIIRDVLFEG